jgi:hypothetical protein
VSARRPKSSTPTGLITSYHLDDDGDLQRGVAWPNPRFTDNGDGTVTDNLTGLMWTKDARPGGEVVTWDVAFNYIATVNLFNFLGYDDWRLPNLFELESLRNMRYDSPVLSNTVGTAQWSEGDPFTNVSYGRNYWSSTTNSFFSDGGFVNMAEGYVDHHDKSFTHFVWPVRGGH